LLERCMNMKKGAQESKKKREGVWDEGLQIIIKMSFLSHLGLIKVAMRLF
jgi:hypothetical protein